MIEATLDYLTVMLRKGKGGGGGGGVEACLHGLPQSLVHACHLPYPHVVHLQGRALADLALSLLPGGQPAITLLGRRERSVTTQVATLPALHLLVMIKGDLSRVI